MILEVYARLYVSGLTLAMHTWTWTSHEVWRPVDGMMISGKRSASVTLLKATIQK